MQPCFQHLMTTRPLGRTGFNASCIGFGDIADRNVPLEECVRTLHRAMDFGLNLIDTAPGYKSGYSEEIVGAALKEKRERMFVINIFSQSPKSWARASTINCPPWAVAVRASWRVRSTLERFLSKCRYFSRRRHHRVWRV